MISHVSVSAYVRVAVCMCLSRICLSRSVCLMVVDSVFSFPMGSLFFDVVPYYPRSSLPLLACYPRFLLLYPLSSLFPDIFFLKHSADTRILPTRGHGFLQPHKPILLEQVVPHNLVPGKVPVCSIGRPVCPSCHFSFPLLSLKAPPRNLLRPFPVQPEIASLSLQEPVSSHWKRIA